MNLQVCLTTGSSVSNKRDLGRYAKPILVPTTGAMVALSVAMEIREEPTFLVRVGLYKKRELQCEGELHLNFSATQ